MRDSRDVANAGASWPHWWSCHGSCPAVSCFNNPTKGASKCSSCADASTARRVLWTSAQLLHSVHKGWTDKPLCLTTTTTTATGGGTTITALQPVQCDALTAQRRSLQIQLDAAAPKQPAVNCCHTLKYLAAHRACAASRLYCRLQGWRQAQPAAVHAPHILRLCDCDGFQSRGRGGLARG